MPDVAAPVRRSSLGHRAPLNGAEVRLAELPFLGKFILRAQPEEAVERLRSALGIGLPFDALTSSGSAEAACLWMGPDEWMLVTAPEAAMSSFEKARQALAGTHHQLTDVSDYYTVVEVVGPPARDLLMKLTTLDLHPRSFKPGMVTGSLFGRVNATIWQLGKNGQESRDAFRLFVRWSMADHLWCLLADAGREWGVPQQVPIKGERLTIP